MLDSTHVKLLDRLFMVFENPPVIRIEGEGTDNPMIEIGDGLLYILATEVEVKSILGPKMVPGFSLERTFATSGDLPDVDTAALADSHNFQEIALRAVVEFAESMAERILDDIVTDNLAQDWKEDQEAVEAAKLEGQEAYDTMSLDANPYPYGIAHYSAWAKGWHEGESEAMRSNLLRQFELDRESLVATAKEIRATLDRRLEGYDA